MAFKKVYVSLQELFPQIDARALRAVAIEHSKDIDAAVVAVLEEIIPFFRERSTPNSPLSQSVYGSVWSEGSSSMRTEHHEVVDKDSMQMNANVHSQGEPLVVISENSVETHQIEVSGDPQTEKTVSADESCASIPQPTVGILQDVEMGVVQKMDCIQEKEDVVDGTVHGISATLGTEDESTSKAMSSQMHIIDIMDEVIANARNNKKILFLEMESVINLMKQVELKEQAAEQAKSEAAEGGMDVLNQVEEVKRMLQRAKETNDMHAGEVYGEKAILATELRELQSRVCSLSDERDKSLAALDEMRQSLEYRLAAAVNEIQAAVLKTLEKEEDARKILAEQDLIMEKVVQESKILKQQAEDNAKLQEFLVDCGRVVDALQGEIGLICLDVKLLKEKFDQHVLLGKSLFSGHTSFILASSSSSLKSLVPDQAETLTVRDDEQLNAENNRIDEKVPEDYAAPREDCKAHVEDDEWEFFDSSEVNS